MKKILSLIILCLIISNVFAQPNERQRIEDSVIGWKTIYSFKGRQYKTMVVGKQVYSAYQQSLRDSFITWMQRTYQPIGGYGDIFQKEFATRQTKGPVPQGIGMDALIYGLYKSDRTGKYEMMPNEDHNDVSIYTNLLAGINPTLFFNSPDGFFFTMPKQNYGSTFTDNEIIKSMKDFGLHEGDRFSKYLVYFPSTSRVTVVLIPGNKLPIVQLTKGEVLEQCERGILRELEDRKADARHMMSNDPSYYARIIKDLDEKQQPQCIKNLNALKEKYRNRLNEPAVLYGWSGPSWADFTSAGSLPTLFVEDWYQPMQGFPVYRYTKEAIENSNKDKPLWVSITWEPQLPNSRVKPYELHRAMLRYFNFDYVYDYFFNPDKVKGVAYQVSNGEEQAARLVRLRRHYIVNENTSLPQGVFFTDNFTSNPDGGRPAGWNDSRGRTPASVVSLKSKPGKWVQLGRFNELSASLSTQKKFPENFTLEFDVATDEFSFRTGGAVKLGLSSYPINAEGYIIPNSKGTEIEWAIEAGNEDDYNNNNYRGESRPFIKSTMAGYEGNYNLPYSLREFTNKKASLHATVKVKNGQARFFVNDKLIGISKDFKQDYCQDCVCKGIPPKTSFRKISFTNTTQNWSPDANSNEVHVYISNIKITEEL